MKKRILVTGGVGYIGSHTVVELYNEGFEVVIADNLSNSELSILDGIEAITGYRPPFEELDLCDLPKVQDLFAKYPDLGAVIHFAASKAVGESVEKPLLYYHNNLASLVNILSCMQQFQVPHLVFSSSCTVYGQPECLPVTEQTPIQKAMSPYGNTKQICEEILADTMASDTSLRAIALRYFNPVGAHHTAAIGELPRGVPNNLMPFITQTAIGKRTELKVFGSDYATVDGTAVRDYIHVVDLAKAHVVAVRRLLEGKEKASLEFFNLGTGTGSSVLQVIQSFERTSGQKLNYKLVERRAGDVEQIWANTVYANEELGWKSEKTLDDMTASAWKWEQKLAGVLV